MCTGLTTRWSDSYLYSQVTVNLIELENCPVTNSRHVLHVLVHGKNFLIKQLFGLIKPIKSKSNGINSTQFATVVEVEYYEKQMNKSSQRVLIAVRVFFERGFS